MLLKRAKMSQKELANLIDCKQSSLSGWINGKGFPPSDVALKIARLFDVNVEYLFDENLGGKEGEPMYAQKVQGKNIIPFSSAKNDNLVYVPFYEDIKASAGNGTIPEEFSHTDVIPILHSFIQPHNPKNVRMMQVTGDSMTEANLFEGDLVFFTPVDSPSNGLHVIGIDDRIYVKRLEFDLLGKEIKVISHNKLYSDHVLKGEDMNRLRVIGKVIGWIHKHFY